MVEEGTGGELTSEEHVEDQAGQQASGVRHVVHPEQRCLFNPELPGNPRHGAPLPHDVPQVHRVLRGVRRVTAAGEGIHSLCAGSTMRLLFCWQRRSAGG